MHPVWRCWCIVQMGQVPPCSPPVIYCRGFCELFYLLPVPHRDFVHCFMMTCWITGLHYQRRSLRSVPGTSLQTFQLKNHQHKPQESIRLAPPHSKASARCNSSLHRIRAKVKPRCQAALLHGL